MKKTMVGVLLAVAVVAVGAQPEPAPAPEIPLSGEQAARYEKFTHELRCLVCQNETIADSQAPLAADLRNQVKRQIADGKSDADVQRYLTDRYGDFVLYRPPFKASTVVLWVGPFLLLALGLVVVWRRLKSAPQPAAPRVVDEAEVQRILRETQAALAEQDASDPRAPR